MVSLRANFIAGWYMTTAAVLMYRSEYYVHAFTPLCGVVVQHHVCNSQQNWHEINLLSHHRPMVASHRSRRQTLQVLNAAATSIKEITDEASDRMSKSIDSVKLSLTSIRTGRASASILDRVKVDYYGTMTPLNQLASISVPSAQQLSIDPFDKKAATDIEKAIIEAELGLTPNNDGNIIRINIPPLTEDRRKELLKQCKSIGEEGKVAIRNVRRDGVETVKKFEKAGTVGEDEMKDGLDVMQKMTDKCVKDIDDIVAKKEKEVMTV